MRVALQILHKIRGALRGTRERVARVFRGITSNQVSISLGSLFGAVTLLQLTLAAYEIEIGPRWGLVLLILTILFFLGAAVALIWPSRHRDKTALETSVENFNAQLRQKFLNHYMDKTDALTEEPNLRKERDQQRIEAISQLQELLVENERVFHRWTQPFVDDQGDLREKAREVYIALYDYYRANTIWLDRQSCGKIEDYLDINHDVLSDLLMLTEPNHTLRAWNLPDDPRAQGEMRSSAVRRVRVDLPTLRKEIEEEFREALRQP